MPPSPGEPRRPDGPRDPGDAWVVADSGERYWGRFGAAGLLALDAERGVLLQHRVSWSHHGDTWALPGGARHQGESATDAALRESAEEAGVPALAIRPRLLSVLDLGIWSYSTLVGDVITPFEPVISDPESVALAWVPVHEVDDLPLHPGFADSWKHLRELLPVRPVVLIDSANVVGSTPDGWWKDRPGAADALNQRLVRVGAEGFAAADLGLGASQWFADIVVVLEGQARAASDVLGLRIERATGSGDDELVAQATLLRDAGRPVTAVTSDAALAVRLKNVGAVVHPVSWLLERMHDGA